jgi:cobalamin biosynthesis protein CbiD
VVSGRSEAGQNELDRHASRAVCRIRAFHHIDVVLTEGATRCIVVAVVNACRMIWAGSGIGAAVHDGIGRIDAALVAVSARQRVVWS